MKILKNCKMSVRISVCVTSLTVLGLLLLWLCIDRFATNTVQKDITNQMLDAVESRSKIINDYIKTAEEHMIAFSKGAEVVNLLEHPENQEHIKQAQEYTEIFAEIKGDYEGLYIANKETYVYTHSNPSAIGITCRSGDSLLEFQNTILKSDKVTNSGIMKSPSTGNMVMPMYYPCFVNGKCIGYVGSAVYAQQLMDSVVGLKMNGLLDCDYLLLNKKNKVYLYHDNQEKLNTEIDEKGLENLLDLIRSDESKTVGTYEYKNNENEKKLLAYVYIPERDWVFLIENNEATIYREVREIRLKIGIVCLCLVVIIGVAIMLICWILGKELKILTQTSHIDFSYAP